MSEQEQQARAEKLEAARAAKAKRAQEHQNWLDDLEIQEEELEAKFEKQLGGKRGIAFELVETPRGFIVVKAGNVSAYNKWLKSETNGEPELHAYVDGNVVHPPLPEFLAATADDKTGAGGVIWRVAAALTAMHDGRVNRQRGK